MTLMPCLRCSTPIPPRLEGCPCCGAPQDALAGETVRPSAALMVGLTLASGCDETDLKPEPAYGIAYNDTGYIDNDGDGYSEVDGDCDDENADIHPEATETPGDGVDSNCDGEDDT